MCDICVVYFRYSLAQQKSYEESTRNSTLVGSPSSCCDETIKCRNGQSSARNNTNNNGKFQQTQSQSTTRVSSPIKYFIPLSPQSTLAMSPTSSNSGSGGNNVCGISGGNFFNHNENISMRKQALLRRMWSREFQHTKYSGSWSPPLKRVAHLQKNRFEKFNTLPEVISSTSCEKCRELGVLGRSFDEETHEVKENKSQSTIDPGIKRDPIANSKSSFTSSSSCASTIVQPIEIKKTSPSPPPPPQKTTFQQLQQPPVAATSTEENHHSKSIIDSNGNNIIICMSSSSTTTFQDQRTLSSQSDTATITHINDDDMLSVQQIDGNNNNNKQHHNLKILRKQYSTQVEEDNNNKPPRTPDDEIYKRLREDKLTEEEIDNYISRMLIDNLNNVIRNVVNENLKSQTSDEDDNLVKLNKKPLYPSQMSSEDLVVSVGRKLLEYEKGGEDKESNMNHENNKFSKRHEMLALLLKKNSFTATPENEDMKNIHNSNETMSNNSSLHSASSPTTVQLAVRCENSENADANKSEIVRYRGQIYQSLPDSYEEGEVAAVISTGTSYPTPQHPETVFVPRVLQAKTESMEVNPSSSSALDDDDFDDQYDSGEEDEFLSDVDSIDGFITMRETREMRKLSEFGYRQHRKAQALFKPIHLKGQAFFVPIVDSEQPIDEHIVVADTMPEKLKEKLILRQRRRDARKQNEIKIKQWQMEKVMDRKNLKSFGEIKMVEKLKKELEVDGTPFKILGAPTSNMNGGRHEPIQANAYRRDPLQTGGGWAPKFRQSQGPPSIPPTIIESVPASEKSSEKSIEIITTQSTTTAKVNPRSKIGNLESYKIDGRGNMQIQNPAKPVQNSAPPSIKTRTMTRKKPTFLSPAAKAAKLRNAPPTIPVRMTNASSNRKTPSHTLINNGNVNNVNPVITSASPIDISGDVRRRQIIKDVQQMSIYKSDLTPDPDSGPSRKMWKTEIKEGDKHIEILEIVECVEGTASSSTAPEHFNFNHHSFTPQPQPPPISNHKINFHVSSSTSTHPTIVNKKTFSVKTTTTTTSSTSGMKQQQHQNQNQNQQENISRIPVPVYRYARSKYPQSYHHQQQQHQQQQHFIRDKSPYENNYSSSTEESLTSAGSSVTNQPQSSTKVDRMIANLLMEALKSPEELGIEFTENHQKRRSMSPNGADSSSTGYYTGDSASRRSASNSAGKYQHRFEVIPEEKSSYTMESSNDDFIDDDEEGEEEQEQEDDEDEENSQNSQNSRVEKLNEINNDWKSQKDLQNNDIKTRSSTPNKLDKDSDDDEIDESKISRD